MTVSGSSEHSEAAAAELDLSAARFGLIDAWH
jgi:hypothetical protein